LAVVILQISMQFCIIVDIVSSLQKFGEFVQVIAPFVMNFVDFNVSTIFTASSGGSFISSI
jgi:hypothetical protein